MHSGQDVAKTSRFLSDSGCGPKGSMRRNASKEGSGTAEGSRRRRGRGPPQAPTGIHGRRRRRRRVAGVGAAGCACGASFPQASAAARGAATRGTGSTARAGEGVYQAWLRCGGSAEYRGRAGQEGEAVVVVVGVKGQRHGYIAAYPI